MINDTFLHDSAQGFRTKPEEAVPRQKNDRETRLWNQKP